MSQYLTKHEQEYMDVLAQLATTENQIEKADKRFEQSDFKFYYGI